MLGIFQRNFAQMFLQKFEVNQTSTFCIIQF